MMGPGEPQGPDQDPNAILNQLEQQLNDFSSFSVDFIDGIGSDVNQGIGDFGNQAGGIIDHVDNDVGMHLMNLDPGGFLDHIESDLAVDYFQSDNLLDSVGNDMNTEFLDGIGDGLSALIKLIKKIAEFISFDWLSQESLDDLAQALARFIVKYAKHMAQETASEAGGEGEGGSSGGSGGGGGGYAWPEWGPSGRYRP